MREDVQRQLELCLTDMLVNLYNSKEQSVYGTHIARTPPPALIGLPGRLRSLLLRAAAALRARPLAAVAISLATLLGVALRLGVRGGRSARRM